MQDSIAASSDLAKEIIESVKTVQSFGAEEEEVKRYEESLKNTHLLQIQRDMVRALYLLIIRVRKRLFPGICDCTEGSKMA